MSHNNEGWTRLTASGIVSSNPVRLYGLIILTSAAANGVQVYNATWADSGQRIVTLEQAQNQSLSIQFTRAILCELGLYVALDANTDECLVVWSPA